MPKSKETASKNSNKNTKSKKSVAAKTKKSSVDDGLGVSSFTKKVNDQIKLEGRKFQKNSLLIGVIFLFIVAILLLGYVLNNRRQNQANFNYVVQPDTVTDLEIIPTTPPVSVFDPTTTITQQEAEEQGLLPQTPFSDLQDQVQDYEDNVEGFNTSIDLGPVIRDLGLDSAIF